MIYGRYRGPVPPAVCKTVEKVYLSAWFNSGPGLIILLYETKDY